MNQPATQLKLKLAQPSELFVLSFRDLRFVYGATPGAKPHGDAAGLIVAALQKHFDDHCVPVEIVRHKNAVARRIILLRSQYPPELLSALHALLASFPAHFPDGTATGQSVNITRETFVGHEDKQSEVLRTVVFHAPKMLRRKNRGTFAS